MALKKKTVFLIASVSLLIVLSLYVLNYRHTLMAVLYQTLGSRNEAIEQFKKAVESNADNAYALYQLGLIYKDMHNLDMAENVYLKLLDLFPDALLL